MTVDGVQLRCQCGSDEVMAVEPGDLAESFGDLLITRRPRPTRAWCLQCWPTSKKSA